MILHLRERGRAGERPPLSLALLAVAALARPEGLLLLALAALDRLLVFERRSRGSRAGGGRPPAPARCRPRLAACALVGPFLFYRWAGGSFLPTTFAAKGGAMRQPCPTSGTSTWSSASSSGRSPR